MATTSRRFATGNIGKKRRTLALASVGLILVLLVMLTAFEGHRFTLSYATRAVAAREYERAKWWIAVTRYLDSESAEAEFLLARIARHEERFQAMDQHLVNAERFGMDRKLLRREAWLVLAADGQMSGIEEELHRWMGTTDRDQVEICEALTNGLAKLARFDEATFLLNAWQQDHPQDARPHFRLGRIHEHFRRKEEAFQEYQTALAKDPKCYEAAFASARLLLEQKRIEEALRWYQRCLELPNRVAGQVGMAECLMSLGKTDEAKKLLEDACAVSNEARLAAYKEVGEVPDRNVGATKLGEIYSQLGDYEKAEGLLRTAVESYPRDLVARYSLAVALRGLGRAEDAETQFTIVRVAREALEEASTLYDHVEANPADVDARYRLGKILLEYESEGKGLFYLQTVLTYDPNHAPTLRLLEEHQKKSPDERLAALGGTAGLPRAAPTPDRAISKEQKIARTESPHRDAIEDSAMTAAFADVTKATGLTFIYRNGQEAGERSILESLGGGVGVLDYDLDGLPDLCLPGGGNLGPGKVISGLPTGLWRSVGPLRYQNVSDAARVAESPFYTHGVAVGDYDNDGFDDLLITAYGGLQLFFNCGDGTFTRATTAAGLTDKLWSTSAAWADFNGDGNLDLYITHYVDWSWDRHPRCPGAVPGTIDVCTPREFNPLPDTVYFSNGDGTFHDATRQAGLDPGGKGLGVIAADVDNDCDVDVYVANDTVNNLLYVNDGNGQFRESGFVSGTAVDHRGIPNGSMGIAVFDYNQDLAPDIWVTNYENETFALYRNEGQDALFLCVSEPAGITVLARLFVGFGTVSGDFDFDGDEDIVVANGHVMYHPKDNGGPQEPVVLSNDGQGRFKQLKFAPDSFFAQKHWGRGLVASDLDRDGDLDLVFVHTNEPAAIVANQIDPPHRSLTVRLRGTLSNRNGIGARAVLDTSYGKQLRLISGGGSYLSQAEFQMSWGIPVGATVRGLTVYWPSGIVQEFDVSSPGNLSAREPVGALTTAN